MTPGMKDPKRNEYLLMPVGKLEREIIAFERTCTALAGSQSPRTDAMLLDCSHRLGFARAALHLIREGK